MNVPYRYMYNITTTTQEILILYGKMCEDFFVKSFVTGRVICDKRKLIFGNATRMPIL